MVQIIIQYVLLVILVVALGYLMYLLKDKGNKFNEDYFGITYNILNSSGNCEMMQENMKKILRLVAELVNYVENNYRYEDNKIKEDKALQLVKEALESINFTDTISDNNIRYIIRISSVMLPSKKN